MPEEHEDIEIRSEEVQEILSAVPVWLIRWGITVVLMIVLAIIALSWIIEYPDVVPGKVILTTTNPPAHLVAKASGRIDLMVDEGQDVKKGSILAVIENPAKTADVLELEQELIKIYPSLYSDDFDPFLIDLNKNYDLGTVQPQFSSFYSSVLNATRTKKIAASEERVKAARESLASAKLQRANIENDLRLTEEKVKIEENIYLKEVKEFSFGGSDSITLLRARGTMVQSQQNLQSVKSQLNQNEIEIRRLQNSLSELVLNNEDNNQVDKNAIKEAYEALESSIYSWKDQFILQSPFDGNVSLSKYWSDNQYIAGGEELLVVIPASEDIIGRLELPIAGSGKVAVGQAVNIKLDNYPSNDFGMLIGEVEKISSVPREGNYSVLIKIPQDMRSTYKKEIPFKQEMLGQANIITEDKKLFQRIFNQLREVINKAS